MKNLTRFVIITSACILLCTHLSAQKNKKGIIEAKGQPRLVVGIVVDQMRYDYLSRFWSQFGEGGFKRLVREGYTVHNCHYNYLPTETAPGHASIHTGTTPSVHGIIMNKWQDPGTTNAHSSVDDPANPRIGDGVHKGASPGYLTCTTLADEIKTANRFRSITVGISLKDRAAILPIGRTGDAAFWMDDKTGYWISSTYYKSLKGKLPDWLNQINTSAPAKTYLSKGWQLSRDVSAYRSPDGPEDLAYEGSFYPDSLPRFPYHFLTDSVVLPFSEGGVTKQVKLFPPQVLKGTPYGNAALEDFAEAAITNMHLGEDEITDFLSLSFSSTDIIGHIFGPQSREVEDTYLRLDKDLEELLRFLDLHCKGRALVFLTADHGGANNPDYAMAHGMEAGWMPHDTTITRVLNAAVGADLIMGIQGHHLYLNKALIQQQGKDLEQVSRKAARALETLPGILRAYTAEELRSTEYLSAPESLLRNGFYPSRSGDVLFIMAPGYAESPRIYPWTDEKGTSHGSPYEYDTHVPLLFWGCNVPAGSTTAPVNITDVAPTVSAMLHILAPSGSTGKVITDIVK